MLKLWYFHLRMNFTCTTPGWDSMREIFLSHPCYLTPKRKFSCEFRLHCLYRTSRNFVVRGTSQWRQFKKSPTSTPFCVVKNATFKIKHSKWKGMQEKKKNQTWVFGADRKFRPSGSLFCITRQSLVMPNNDPRDGIFYPHLTPM